MPESKSPLSSKQAILREPQPRMPRDTYLSCLKVVRAYLRKNDSIRNREIREVAGINYDQAIAFFNLAITEKALIRKGVSGGTHYVLPQREK